MQETTTATASIAIADISVLARLAHAASDDPNRHVLCGIHLEQFGKNVRATATDGKILATAIFYDVGELHEPVTIPTVAVKRKTDGGDRKGPLWTYRLIVTHRAGYNEVKVMKKFSGDDATNKNLLYSSYATIQGTYPDYLQVLPAAAAKASPTTGQFDHRLIARAAKVFGLRNKTKTREQDHMPILFSQEDRGPSYGVGNQTLVLLMPLVTDSAKAPVIGEFV